MSAAPTLPPPTEPPNRKRFTRAEFDRFQELGAFDGQRYELIDGDLIDKMGQNPPHARAIRRAKSALGTVVDPDLVQVQAPIEVSIEDRETSLPEPDVSVLREDKPDYDERHPRGNELLLVMEISDTSVAFDLSRKATLYAKAGVPEYWVLDLNRRRLVVHRQPDGSEYRLMQVFTESDSLTLQNRSETIRVADLLPGTV